MVQTEQEPAEPQPDLNPSCGTVGKSFTLLNHFCCFSVAKSCPALCDPMNSSPPGSSVLHCLPVWSDSYPLSWWCYLTISSSVIPFSSCLQSFPALGSFPVSQIFTSGSKSIRASASAWPSNEYAGLIFFGIDWANLFLLRRRGQLLWKSNLIYMNKV